MVTLKLATKDNKDLYKNLFNILHNDLSLYNDELSNIDENGYFDAQTVDIYFNNDSNILPFLIYNDSRVAGLIVLTKSPYVKKGCDYCIQETMVLNLYRGKNIAFDACRELFKKFAGRYCLLVYDNNKRAFNFWNKVINQLGVLVSKIKIDEKSTAFEFEVK